MLDPNNAQRVIDWISVHCPNMRCGLCQSQQFEVQDMIAPPAASFVSAGGDYAPKPKTSMPLVSLSCNHCGNVLFFSPVKMGLLRLPATQPWARAA